MQRYDESIKDSNERLSGSMVWQVYQSESPQSASSARNVERANFSAQLTTHPGLAWVATHRYNLRRIHLLLLSRAYSSKTWVQISDLLVNEYGVAPIVNSDTFLSHVLVDNAKHIESNIARGISITTDLKHSDFDSNVYVKTGRGLALA